MPNMKIPLNEGFCVEIKLKWLMQSRDAPPNARRCRTCALAASKGKEVYFCPLKLASESEKEREDAIQNIVMGVFLDWSESPWHPEFKLLEHHHPQFPCLLRLESFFANEGRRLILRLRKLQDDFDKTGVLSDSVNLTLPLAMTLRDCTLFMKIPNDENKPIEARFGDLDVKSIRKVPEWRRKERELIDGGWYTRGLPIHQNCLLSQTRAKGESSGS